MADFDTAELEKIIHGKIEPHIYAFQTGAVPDYIKVGDTYRPVEKRLEEWRKFYPDLVPLPKSWSARLDEKAYFRDFEVHKYLTAEKHRERLERGIFPLVYYSKEFFKNARQDDIDEAIGDISNAYSSHTQK